MSLETIVPVVLCGGAGWRLRPLSRPDCPKPFLRIGSRYSMLQETLMRVRDCAPPVLVLNALLRHRAEDDLKSIATTPRSLILEPWGRNTAPALASAAAMLDNDLMLVLPSDHWIKNPEALLSAVKKAVPLARDGWIISFGIRPRRANTGFGYIRRGPVMQDGIHRIDRFVEKPPRNVARIMVRSGTCDWNSGIFLLSAAIARQELARFEPEMMKAAASALTHGLRDGNCVTLGAGFETCAPLSIDTALMERSDKTLVVPVDLDWSDLGTWPAIVQKVFA